MRADFRMRSVLQDRRADVRGEGDTLTLVIVRRERRWTSVGATPTRGGRSRTKKSGWILGNAYEETKSRRASIFSGGITGRPIADEEGRRRHAEGAILEYH